MNTDWFAIACNPLHSTLDRIAAWMRFEEGLWFSAVRERGLRLDDVPTEYYARIRDRLRELERTEAKTLRAD